MSIKIQCKFEEDKVLNVNGQTVSPYTVELETGESVTLNATMMDGYMAVWEDEKGNKHQNPFTYTLTADVTESPLRFNVGAKELPTYKFTFKSAGKGKMKPVAGTYKDDPSGALDVTEGGWVTFGLWPDDGHVVGRLEVVDLKSGVITDATSLISDGEYTVTNVMNDMLVYAYFAELVESEEGEKVRGDMERTCQMVVNNFKKYYQAIKSCGSTGEIRAGMVEQERLMRILYGQYELLDTVTNPVPDMSGNDGKTKFSVIMSTDRGDTAGLDPDEPVVIVDKNGGYKLEPTSTVPQWYVVDGQMFKVGGRGIAAVDGDGGETDSISVDDNGTLTISNITRDHVVYVIYDDEEAAGE